MIRILKSCFVGLTLLAAIVIAGLWIVSSSAGLFECCWIGRPEPSGQRTISGIYIDGHTTLVGSIDALDRLSVDLNARQGLNTGWIKYGNVDSSLAFVFFVATYDFGRTLPGPFAVAWRSGIGSVTVSGVHCVVVPTWLPVLVLLLPSAWRVRGWLRRRRWRRQGRCEHCGYDLRASPGRCPECGQERCAESVA